MNFTKLIIMQVWKSTGVLYKWNGWYFRLFVKWDIWKGKKMVLYCAFFGGLGIYKKIYFLFCTALFCLSSNPDFFKIVLKFYKCIELQYFDLELIYNCLLSVNKICWFWWGEQLKKRKNCLKNWYMNVVEYFLWQN